MIFRGSKTLKEIKCCMKATPITFFSDILSIVNSKDLTCIIYVLKGRKKCIKKF